MEPLWHRRDCVSAELDDSLVLLDLDTLVYHSLNRTAAAVWELLEQPRSAPELTEALCERFRVSPEHCRASLDRLLDDLATRNLVSPAPPAA